MITLEQLFEEQASCLCNLKADNVNTLLCQVVQYIIEKEYFFLLDFVYPWELIDSSCSIEHAALVIAREPAIDGFYLLKTIPMSEILYGRIETELSEVNLENRYLYIQEQLNRIPRFED